MILDDLYTLKDNDVIDLHVQLRTLLFGGQVRRYHTVPQLAPQTNSQHQWGVALFCNLLTQGAASRNLLLAALTHDLAEQIYGDTPAPAKRALQGVAEVDTLNEAEKKFLSRLGLAFHLTDEEKIVLKIADYMEGMLHCIHERAMGNATAANIFHRFFSYVRNYTLLPHQEEILGTLQYIWEEVNG